ncbi:UDP-3-O-(3-hydroxymyristoyl)glucosamine N-acyltransferase [Marinomonas epiphytica]
MGYSLAELASKVQGEVYGDPQWMIESLGTLQSADAKQLSFLANPKYASQLATSSAGAVLVKSLDLAKQTNNAIVVANPYLAFAQLTQLYLPTTVCWQGIHDSAVISSSASIGEQVVIGPNVVIDDDVVIGAGSTIGAGCVLSRGSQIGEGCQLYPNVTLYHDVCVGRQCIVHSGAVIGADGFGFAPQSNGWQKIHQLGSVTIGDQVEIGANTTIDRGAIENTQIGNGVKIDNQVQIAHNVIIGDNSAIAGGVLIAGSVEIGQFCTIAGGVGIAGHLSLTDRVHVTALSLISHSITEPGSYSSGTGMEPSSKWRRTVARLRRIDETAKQVLQLKKQVNKLLDKVEIK